MAVAVSGCGEDPPEDYTQEIGDAFFRACVEPLEDDLLHLELCQCVFDASQRAIPYAEFVRIESRLRDQPTASLPPRLVVLIAECVVDVADL
jgi:hypothetical protein